MNGHANAFDTSGQASLQVSVKGAPVRQSTRLSSTMCASTPPETSSSGDQTRQGSGLAPPRGRVSPVRGVGDQIQRTGEGHLRVSIEVSTVQPRRRRAAPVWRIDRCGSTGTGRPVGVVDKLREVGAPRQMPVARASRASLARRESDTRQPRSLRISRVLADHFTRIGQVNSRELAARFTGFGHPLGRSPAPSA